jgi:hypothetical protein
MARSPSNVPPKLGSIVAIPLPNGKFAFAKVFKDHNLGIYDLVSDQIEPVDQVTKHKVAFHRGVVDKPMKSGEWPVIGEEPFISDDDAWPPIRAAGVLPGAPINPHTVGTNFKGVSRPAKMEEIVGMEMSTFYPRPEHFVNMIVDRLVKGNHEKYRVPA